MLSTISMIKFDPVTLGVDTLDGVVGFILSICVGQADPSVKFEQVIWKFRFHGDTLFGRFTNASLFPLHFIF